MKDETPAPNGQAQPGSPAPPPAEEEAKPDYYDQLLRLKAEFENYRKRVDREKPELFRIGKAEVLLKLLPLFDLLRHAHTEVKEAHWDTPLAKGMEGIFKEFDKIFREEGVEAMDPIGRPYDPLKHEVLGTVSKSGYDDGSVAEVLQGGFLLNGKVLRPAKVRIAKKEEGK